MMIRIKPQVIIAFIIISLCARYYYLVDYNDYLWIMPIKYSHLAVALALLWGFVMWCSVINKMNNHFKYSYYMIGFIVLIFTSAFQAYILYDQGLLKGIFVQYFVFTWALLYFSINKNVYYNKISVNDIKKLIKIVGTIQLIIFIGQYFLTDFYVFVHVYEAHRYGQIRYYFSPILLDLFLFLELDEFFKINNSRQFSRKLTSICYMIAILFEIIVVQKYRLTAIGLVLCIGLGVLLAKGSALRKIWYIFIAVIVLFFLLKTTMAQDIINELIYGKTYSGAESTLAIRKIGRLHYLKTYLSHPILGGGYPLVGNRAAYEASGAALGISLVDNGFWGLTFIYGSIGAILMSALWFKMLRYGWLIFKAKGQLAYLLFPLFFLITGINEAHWYWDDGFMVFTLFLIIQEHEFLKINSNFEAKKYMDFKSYSYRKQCNSKC